MASGLRMLSDSDLVSATFRGDQEAVQKLIDSKADVNARDGAENAALHVAAYNGDLDLVWLLCDAGASINSCDKGGATPLILASKQGHGEVARLLVSQGADAKLKEGTDGQTALEIARSRGHADVVSLLDPSSAGGLAVLSDDESEEEAEDPNLITGNAVVVDHLLKLDVPLARFDWTRYEESLAKLAGVRPSDVLVTVEPGSVCVEAHATIVVRLANAAGSLLGGAKRMPASAKSPMSKTMATLKVNGASDAANSATIDYVVQMMSTLKKPPSLKQAAGGATIVGTPQVHLLGDVATEDAAFVRAAQSLLGERAEHDEGRDAFDEARREFKAVGNADGAGKLALEAAKAILLLRPRREAIKEAAAQAAAASTQRRKRR